MSRPLPTLTSADLDPATLEALFADLEALADIEEVQIKGASATRAGLTDLAEARRALAYGAHGVQIRYRWEGQGWLDTLLRTPGGLRLVRSPAPSMEAP